MQNMHSVARCAARMCSVRGRIEAADRGIHTRRICGPLRSELASAQPKLVPQPADVGPGSAFSTCALGSVLDSTKQQLKLAAPPIACGLARRVASEQLERFVQPAAVVVVEELALEVAGFRRRQSGRWLVPRGAGGAPARGEGR